MPTNYFGHSKDHPYHISVGAVVLNDKDEVAVHHFSSLERSDRTYRDFYILMRETIEPNETIEFALGRGLSEEMGMSAELVTYIGSLVVTVPYDDDHDQSFQKTTLYFLMRLTEWHEDRRLVDDPESGSVIEWHPINELIAKMRDQARRYPDREDLDEAAILKRAEKLMVA